MRYAHHHLEAHRISLPKQRMESQISCLRKDDVPSKSLRILRRSILAVVTHNARGNQRIAFPTSLLTSDSLVCTASPDFPSIRSKINNRRSIEHPLHERANLSVSHFQRVPQLITFSVCRVQRTFQSIDGFPCETMSFHLVTKPMVINERRVQTRDRSSTSILEVNDSVDR